MTRQEPDSIDVVLDSDYYTYYWDSEDSFVVFEGIESGSVAPFTLETLPNPASCIEDGSFLGYFTWEIGEYDNLIFTKVKTDD